MSSPPSQKAKAPAPPEQAPPAPKGVVPPPAAKQQAKGPPPPEGGDGKEVSAAAFKAAFEIAKVLAELSKKDQLSAMQMAGIQAGLSVTSQFAATAALQRAVATASSPKGKGTGRPPAPSSKKWGNDVKVKQSEIANLNKAIAEESAKAGAQLPSGHDLLKRRDQAFRDLKGLKSKGTASQ